MPSHQFEAHLASLAPVAELRSAALIDFVCRLEHSAIDQFGGLEPFVAWERQLYDQYIAPVDVPWVPDVIEPALIDAPAKMLIEALTRRAYLRGAPLLPPAPVTPPAVGSSTQGSAAP